MPFLAVLFAALLATQPLHADGILYSDPEKGYELELGALDPSNSDPLLGTSSYFGARKYGSKSGKWFDWSYDSKLFVLDLEARYGEGSPSESENIFLGSALGTVGRAYHLFGPIDVGWSVMGVMRATELFPNLSLDETAAIRWKLSDNHAMGFFTGLTQSAVEGGRTWTETLEEERTATHNALAFWGKTQNDIGYRVEMGRQENATTNIETLSSSFAIPTNKDPVSLRLRLEEETGDSIEFHRKRTSLGSEFRVGRNWDMGVDIGKDEISFGGVEQESRSLMLTFRYRPKESRGNILFKTARTAHKDTTPAIKDPSLAQRVYDAVQELDALLDLIPQELTALDPQELAVDLSAAIAALPPRVREALEEEVGEVEAQQIADLIEQVQSEIPAARDELARISEMLSEPGLLERLAVRATRKELYATLAKQEFDVLGKTVRMTPPQLIALAHVYGLGNEPLPPVTDRDIDKWINDECGGPLRDCILSRIPKEQRAVAEAAWPDDAALADSVRWAADLAKREVNRILLNVMLAAERLDTLTVGNGLRPGELNRGAVRSSFESLDKRQIKQLAPVFAKARARINP